MEILTLVVVVACIAGLGFLINLRLGKLLSGTKPQDELMEIIRLLREGSEKDRVVLLDSLQRNTQSLNQRLDNAAKVIGQVQKNIGEIGEIGRGMRDFQQFLQSPKIRGNIGEQVLNLLLDQMLPKQSFHLQYTFKSGEKVDACIKTSAGMIPVDSKFPMENFRQMNASTNSSEKQMAEKQFIKDVKTHIDAISKKYILTEEGTIDYALMYIPSEAVYYEIVNNPSLFEYSSDKRVLPVSPTTFYAYLRAILASFEGQKVEATARQILSSVKAIQKEYAKVGGSLAVLNKHLGNAHNTMSSVLNSYSHLGQTIVNTRSLEEKTDEKLLEEKSI